MKAIALSTLAAIVVFLIGMPIGLSAGATGAKEAVGWTVILAMFFTVPALIAYGAIFGVLFAAPVRGWIIVPLAGVVPVAGWIVTGMEFPAFLALSAVAGGLMGGIVMALLKPDEQPAEEWDEENA